MGTIVAKQYGNLSIKRCVLLSFFFALGVTIMPFANSTVLAAYAQSFVRFDRMKISSATTGTVCMNPVTTDTEAAVGVTFPAGYTVSTTLANWTISTTNNAWPTGSTAWPGIGSATAVNGQVVTFPSSDLMVGTMYCFNWSNASALTTKTSATNSNTGLVETYTSTPTSIDSGTYASATIADDQIVVSATVPPAFSFALSGNTDPLGTLNTSTVTTSASPRTVTVNTNAQNGWTVWAKSAYQGLCSPSVGTCTPGTPTTQLATTSTGSNRTLVAGTTDYTTGVTSSQVGGAGTITVAAAFAGTSTGQGGGLSATALQALATSSGTANTAVLTIKNNVAISPTVPAASDYTDTITIVGAGLF